MCAKQTGKDVKYEVNAHGSLGLFALGAVGVKAWRKKQLELKKGQRKKKRGE